MPDMSRCAALARQAAAQIGEHPDVDQVLVMAPSNQVYVSLIIMFHTPAWDPHDGLDLNRMHADIGERCGISTSSADMVVWEHPCVLRTRWYAP